jgi:hypothetical protein
MHRFTAHKFEVGKNYVDTHTIDVVTIYKKVTNPGDAEFTEALKTKDIAHRWDLRDRRGPVYLVRGEDGVIYAICEAQLGI